MGTGLQARPQSPAFEVTDIVARHNGFVNPGAPEETPRNQERIGSGSTRTRGTVGGNNVIKKTIAGATTRPNASTDPTTRRTSIVASRQHARGIVGTNFTSRKGSGSVNKPRPIAGTDDVFNVGGTGGRSAILVKLPHAAHLPNLSSHVAQRKARGGATQKMDPSNAPLKARVAVPVHMGFNHVGYR